MTFTRRTVDAGGRTLRFLEATPAGARATGTLVLLHAFPMNARMWEPQLALAAHGWRIVAPQLRQFDDGAGEPAAASMDDYADDVDALLGALKIPHAVVGGLSMGGYIAFALLRRSPQLVQALVLADTRPQADTPEAVEGRKRMLKLVEERGAGAVADEMIPKLLGETTRTGRPEIVRQVRAIAAGNAASAIAGAVTAMMRRPDSMAQIASLAVPACIIVGAEDTVTPPAVAEEMHRAIPGSQLSVIAAAGHLSNIERPDAFNRAVGRFLDALPR